jgi:hypothetical protein
MNNKEVKDFVDDLKKKVDNVVEIGAPDQEPEVYTDEELAEHISKIKSIERMIDCKYCNKEFVIDIPTGKEREKGEIIGIYKCRFCGEGNVVYIDNPYVTDILSRKPTVEDTNQLPEFEGRFRPIIVQVSYKKKER